MSSSAKKPLPIAVLISGTGRSLKNLIEKIRAGELDAEIRLVIASTSRASGLQYAEMANIPIKVIERSSFESDESFSREVFKHCTEKDVRYVIMAGYLRLLTIPQDYMGRVVNIHPSLIPSFCGKGKYGHLVHEAALEYGVKVSGCTVHFVNNDYDNGPVILQKVVPVYSNDTPQSLNDRVFYDAECVAYPEAIQLLAEERVHIDGRKVIIDGE